MAGFGETNPFPLDLGGGPSEVERALQALTDAMGTGGSAADGTIDHAWRVAMAKGLVASHHDERAMLQAFPELATDHIPVHEELLGVLPPIAASEQDRRLETTERWTRVIDASMPAELQWLVGLDSRLSVLSYDPEDTGVTHLGRAFEPYVPTFTSPAFGGGRKGSGYPNYSDEFVVIVFFDLGSGVAPNAGEVAIMNTIRERLNEDLPAWVSFRIITDVGFILDQSLLDVGAFGAP